MELTAIKSIFNAILKSGLIITLTMGCLTGSLLGSIMTGFDFNDVINTFIFAFCFALIVIIIAGVLACLIIEKRRALIDRAFKTAEGRKKTS